MTITIMIMPDTIILISNSSDHTIKYMNGSALGRDGKGTKYVSYIFRSAYRNYLIKKWMTTNIIS